MKSARPWRYSKAVSVDESRFVEAIADKQNYTVIPESHYYAMQLRCEACESSFWFSENEQQHWCEMLGFWIDSVPKRRPNCRRALRANAQRP